jgi:hypothetical protein
MNPSPLPLPPPILNLLGVGVKGWGAESRLNKAALNNTRGLWVWYVGLHLPKTPSYVLRFSLGYSKETDPLSLSPAFAYVSTYRDLHCCTIQSGTFHYSTSCRRQVFTLKFRNSDDSLFSKGWALYPVLQDPESLLAYNYTAYICTLWKAFLRRLNRVLSDSLPRPRTVGKKLCVSWKCIFSAVKSSFRLITSIWPIIGHLCAEMAAEPPFHIIGLLHMLSRLQIPLRISSCFHQWWKGTFSAIVKGHWWKVDFSERWLLRYLFLQRSRRGPVTWCV